MVGSDTFGCKRWRSNGPIAVGSIAKIALDCASHSFGERHDHRYRAIRAAEAGLAARGRADVRIDRAALPEPARPRSQVLPALGGRQHGGRRLTLGIAR